MISTHKVICRPVLLCSLPTLVSVSADQSASSSSARRAQCCLRTCSHLASVHICKLPRRTPGPAIRLLYHRCLYAQKVHSSCAVQDMMSRPEVASNPDKFKEVAKEAAKLEHTVDAYRAYDATLRTLRETEEMLRECEGNDEEMAEMARAEVSELQPQDPGVHAEKMIEELKN